MDEQNNKRNGDTTAREFLEMARRAVEGIVSEVERIGNDA